MKPIEIACIAATVVFLIVVGVVIMYNKDKFTHLPNLITFPPNVHTPSRSLEVNVPMGSGKMSEGLELEHYSLDNPQKTQCLANFQKAYIDPPNLLQLPPNKPFVPPSRQKLHEVSGIPEGMYVGSDYMYSEYTPDYLCCKAGVI
jgi:hypothetical protein